MRLLHNWNVLEEYSEENFIFDKRNVKNKYTSRMPDIFKFNALNYVACQECDYILVTRDGDVNNITLDIREVYDVNYALHN